MVIDWTVTGASPPTGTSPTWIRRVWRRGKLTPPGYWGTDSGLTASRYSAPIPTLTMRATTT
ncbi:MAG: hypothetical protein U5R31_12510 [Acidimicrobiia bacterium]|nr:hypothetical protein [Acidimicrobiia bacterium]